MILAKSVNLVWWRILGIHPVQERLNRAGRCAYRLWSGSGADQWVGDRQGRPEENADWEEQADRASLPEIQSWWVERGGGWGEQDCSEDTILALLFVLSVLDPADTQQIKQLCKRLSSSLTGLLEPFACDITLDNIDNRDSSNSDLLARVHGKVLEKIVEIRNFSCDVLTDVSLQIINRTDQKVKNGDDLGDTCVPEDRIKQILILW